VGYSSVEGLVTPRMPHMQETAQQHHILAVHHRDWPACSLPISVFQPHKEPLPDPLLNLGSQNEIGPDGATAVADSLRWVTELKFLVMR
jgi:hypothetical protein